MIGICYIATGKYFRYFETFKREIVNFCPGNEKFVVVFTDKKETSQLIQFYKKGVRFFFMNIENLPWPMVTMFKFRRIQQTKQLIEGFGFDCSYIVNLDATVIPNREIQPEEFLFEGKIGVIQHFLWNQISEQERADSFWVDYDKSIAWRDSRKIKWQAFPGFLSCPFNLVDNMCNEIEEMIAYDLKNYVIPYYHDESYYNKYLDNHPELVQLVEDQVWEDDDEEWCQYNLNAMWRVLGYDGLQEEKWNKQ